MLVPTKHFDWTHECMRVMRLYDFMCRTTSLAPNPVLHRNLTRLCSGGTVCVSRGKEIIKFAKKKRIISSLVLDSLKAPCLQLYHSHDDIQDNSTLSHVILIICRHQSCASLPSTPEPCPTVWAVVLLWTVGEVSLSTSPLLPMESSPKRVLIL